MKRILDHPKLITFLMALSTLGFILVAVLPSLWPEKFPALNAIHVDTDPENMLPKEEATRLFHTEMKTRMSLYDMVVLGVVNEKHPEGVFNKAALENVFELTEYAKILRWPDPERPGEQIGVVEVDLLAPSTVDNMEQGGLGVVTFEWLMPRPPASDAEALAIRRKAARIPFLNGTLLSEDGKALALYIPITSKEISHRVATALKAKIATFSGEERYHITGLPVAEDTFGVEMFIQMAISAPIAMLVIFLLMYFFFRRIVLIISPMIVAMVSVFWTMGLLIATGNTIHIMSSMIPIFIMPIAVLDAIHILSDFFDRYDENKDRKETVLEVMRTLFKPMLYTSLTTMAGFASLAFTPIPPVQTFGLFIAFGVFAAWFWTVTFIPASIMLIPQRRLKNFGLKQEKAQEKTPSIMTRFLEGLGQVTYDHPKKILGAAGLLALVAVFGILQIRINDNPVKWFKASHPIRVADRILNAHFGGTYMAYLALEPEALEAGSGDSAGQFLSELSARAAELESRVPSIAEVVPQMKTEVLRLQGAAASDVPFLDRLETFVNAKLDSAPFESVEAWEDMLLLIDRERQKAQIFKQPEVLTYMSRLQDHLLTTGIVGKSNSLADVVKTVHRELFLGEAEAYRIPNTSNAVAQTLLTYQNSHRPQDLWHFVTPDFRTSSIWVQLKSGDNIDMARVVDSVDRFIQEHPPALALKHRWFGLTYINVVWQEKMVSGMLEAFIGSFLIVLVMMVVLFRSLLWGLLSMIPLTLTIGLIYGVIGLIGKDYDMPVAVLSSLSLGLSVDYAIHFLAHARVLEGKYGTWALAHRHMFGGPVRAIVRNAVVVGLGFLPLLAAPLVPYQTVGFFIAAILLTAGAATILILPALITPMASWLFPKKQALISERPKMKGGLA